jgi:hypothetical protein
MILWSLLVGLLLIAVLQRLDLAVEPTTRSSTGAAARTAKMTADPETPSAGELAAPGLPDPVHLPVPPAPGLAARTRPHRPTPVAFAGLVHQLTRRLVPRKSRSTPVSPG